MLVEIWEWLRGYNRWTQAEARIAFLKEDHVYHDAGGKELHYSHVTGRRLVWTDALGQTHQAPFKQLGDEPKYQLAEAEIEAIRYNPTNPEQFYCRRLSTLKIRYYVSMTFSIIFVIVFCIGYIWIRKLLGCSR